MDTKSALRQIKIKTGVLRRCTKDYSGYAEEKIALEEQLEALKAAGAEEGKIR